MEQQEKAESRKLNNKRIVLFLIITFVITYGFEIFMIAPLVGSTDINQALLAQSMIAGMMFVPTIGAVLTRLITKEGFVGKNLYVTLEIKKNLKYYLFSWFGFAGLILFGTALYFLLFPTHFDGNLGYLSAAINAQRADNPFSPAEIRQIMMVQLVQGIILSPFVNLINCFGEEWGWRGYLLPHMLERFKVVPTLVLSGVIWGLWHAPITVMGHNYGVGYLGYPFTGILAMCLFCIVIGIILSYMTIKTKSCIPAVLGHGMLNGFGAIGIYCTSLENPYHIFLGPAPTGLIGGAGFIALAVFLLRQLYKEEKRNVSDSVSE